MALYSANLRAVAWPKNANIGNLTIAGNKAMYRYAFIAAMLIAMLPSAPSFAVSQKDKMATCKFGADDQKLLGAARATFLKRCMANRDDPRGPAPGAAPAGTTPAAAGVPPPPKQ
jgi:hypothetical protein